MLPDSSCTAPPSQSQLHCFGKNAHSLLVLKFPNIKKKSHTIQLTVEDRKKGKTRLTFITANCLGYVGICQLFPLKISVVSLYKLRQWTAQNTQNKKQKSSTSLSLFLLHFLGISVSSRFWLVSAHNQSLPLDLGG